MLVLVSWLREFAPDLPDDIEVLTAALDDLGTPVEERRRLGEGLEGIVVAHVLATRPPRRRPHPARRRRHRRR